MEKIVKRKRVILRTIDAIIERDQKKVRRIGDWYKSKHRARRLDLGANNE